MHWTKWYLFFRGRGVARGWAAVRAFRLVYLGHAVDF